MSTSRPLMFINNSRETFTPTRSGAIATCLLEVGRQAIAGGTTPVLITRRHHADPATIEWPELRLVDAVSPEPGTPLGQARRIRRRLNGWARPDQWEYAKQIVPLVKALDPIAVLLSNDPELAVDIRRRWPDLTVVHWFHNLELASDRFRRRYSADQGIVSVAVSRYLARAVENVYRLTPETVHSVPNGVDLKRFAAPDRPCTDPPVVGYLGRVAVEKGLDVLLQAALLVAERGIAFTLQVAGDTNWGESNESPFTRRLAGILDELRDAGVKVQQLGHLTTAQVPGALAAVDIHVVPSRWDEPFGLTVVEGLASGRPVVASAVGGIPEVLGAGGQLFPREDPEALAAVLAGLLEDRSQWRDWAARARLRAEQLPWSVTWAGIERLMAP